jgi:hypothetical protein
MIVNSLSRVYRSVCYTDCWSKATRCLGGPSRGLTLTSFVYRSVRKGKECLALSRHFLLSRKNPLSKKTFYFLVLCGSYARRGIDARGAWRVGDTAREPWT